MHILESSSLDIGQEVLVPRSKKRKVVKTPDDKIPLPDPYPLPKHFKSDVEADLKSCNMSTTILIVFSYLMLLHLCWLINSIQLKKIVQL